MTRLTEVTDASSTSADSEQIRCGSDAGQTPVSARLLAPCAHGFIAGMASARYYRHSGHFSPLAVAQAVGLGLLVAVPMAFVYSYILVYLPIIGVITFLLTAGFAGTVGLAAGYGMHARKLRNDAAAVATALPVALFALWASWVTWVYAILDRADADVGLVDLAANPGGLWSIINVINEKGAWSFKGTTPTGALLWGMWGLEAVIIVGVVVLVAHSMVSSPFCEACDRWCEEHKGFAVLGPTRKETLKARLEQGDYTVLREMRETNATTYTRLDLHQCAKCQVTTALTATSITVTLKKGKEEKNETVMVKHLLLSPSDLSAVKTILTEGQAA